MLIDMHIHTQFSPCSIINIPQLITVAEKKGLDGICITDHDTMASKSIVQKLEISGVCIIIGIEYTTSKGDFLVFGPTDYIPSRMTVEDLLSWIEKESGVVIPAHPFRKSRPADIGILSKFSIIEVLNGRNLPSENEGCRDWIRKNGKNIGEIGGSDAHTLDEVGSVITVFEKNIYCLDDLIRELHGGKYSPRQVY
jgi:predicted metal-dependent phosphoesterase TrpH